MRWPTLIGTGLLLVAATAAGEGVDAGAMADMEIGARVGLQPGVGGATPGGLRLGGVFLYRMSESTWFDAEAAFTFGGGGEGCSATPGGDSSCQHGPTDGFSAQGGGTVRVLLPWARNGVVPYARGGLAFHVAHFGDDALTGLAIPLVGATGARMRVSERIALGGEAALLVGPVFYGGDVGTEPYAALVVQLGVELAL